MGKRGHKGETINETTKYVDKRVNNYYYPDMNLGRYLRNRRDTAGISLRKLANTIHVDPAYLSRVERGKVPPSDEIIQSIANALRVDREELFLLAGRVPPYWQQAICSSPERAVKTFRSALASFSAERTISYGPSVISYKGVRAIEDQDFPFESLSNIAELESWRKEINRPIYHIHKWWAQRLGSVFRAILLGAFAPKGSNILEMFYQPARLPGSVIFDPFMGSGTTVGEALKLGARVIGRDINPVAHFLVRNALSVHSREKVIDTFKAIEKDIAQKIRYFYKAQLPKGGAADVLYYFWVKIVSCPKCKQHIDLFTSYIFAQHAYPDRYPEARALCPHCGAINVFRYDAEDATCVSCHKGIKPRSGPAHGAKVLCPYCNETSQIAKLIQEQGRPPVHRLYAKMVLRSNGSKEYLPADNYDFELYREASRVLQGLKNAYPITAIEPGYNTDQVLNYCYTHWHQMFNDRQLLCLTMLAKRIRSIQDEKLRSLFACFFSGMLEFNNMFASFKGEGTGAVRHMFSHHILKPERTPLEANIWGTPKSSGAFSTLFESRILRALDYRENPFETRVQNNNGRKTGEKVFGLSCSLGHDVAESFAEFREGKYLYLSCGDSAKTDVSPESVDAVVTDPPFFDNVHYSQLADFFYVWQCYVLGKNGRFSVLSTRSPNEVQHSDSIVFTERLGRVWTECHRVLRPDGLLIFTYHHSRTDGWRSILEAIIKAGFVIVAAHPIKAEMSVAAPKQQAKEPIDIDMILVCRKREAFTGKKLHFRLLVNDAAQEAAMQIERFNITGRRLSRNDVRVILMAQTIKRFSAQDSIAHSVTYLDSSHSSIEKCIDSLSQRQRIKEHSSKVQKKQLALW